MVCKLISNDETILFYGHFWLRNFVCFHLFSPSFFNVFELVCEKIKLIKISVFKCGLMLMGWMRAGAVDDVSQTRRGETN